MGSDLIGVWIAAFLTLGIMSFLYKDNPWYKFSEAIFVGLSAGYWFASLFWQSLHAKFWANWSPAVQSLFQGQFDYNLLYTGAGILGLMMLLRLIPPIGWISRWPLSVVVGGTAGLYLINYLVSNAVRQIGSTIQPVVTFPESIGWVQSGGIIIGNVLVFAVLIVSLGFILFGRNTTIDLPTPTKLFFFLIALVACALGTFYSLSMPLNLTGLIIFMGVFCGLIYFFFSKEHTGFFGGAATVGTWFLMVTFGASFGYTVMSRMSLLIGRIDFLLVEWLKVVR
jgi:hypothetical protein